MKILVQISNSMESYLSNLCVSYKRVKMKGQLPPELVSEFEGQLVKTADLIDKIREHVDKLPEQM
jgi:hypothetical protein